MTRDLEYAMNFNSDNSIDYKLKTDEEVLADRSVVESGFFRKAKNSLTGLVLGAVMAGSLLGLPVKAYSGITVNVPSQYSTIQDAVDNLPDGVVGDPNVVQLAPGNYTGPGNRDVRISGRNHLTIKGGTDLSDAVNYTIDAEGLARGVVIYNGSQGISLESFTGKNGFASGSYYTFRGVPRDSSFESPTAGGGFATVDGSNVSLRYVILTNNVANDGLPGVSVVDGGAIHFMNISTGSVEDSIISDSTATHSAGGIAVHRSNVAVKRNKILRNTGMDSTSSGGILYITLSTGEISNNLIAHNRAWRVSYPEGGLGGGVLLSNSDPLVANNIIEYNSTREDSSNLGFGGGLRIRGSPISKVVNNIIRNNDSNPNVKNVDFLNSVPLAAYNNNWENFVDEIVYIQSNPGVFVDSKGNIDADPMFDVDGISLLLGSPNIDSGTSNGAPSIDYFGNPRPSGSGYDIGLHEYQFPTPTPTLTPTPIPTDTPTLVPTDTPTPIPTDTPTPLPTDTPTPLPTDTPTPDPTSTPTPYFNWQGVAYDGNGIPVIGGDVSLVIDENGNGSLNDDLRFNGAITSSTGGFDIKRAINLSWEGNLSGIEVDGVPYNPNSTVINSGVSGIFKQDATSTASSVYDWEQF